jgi:hypothetical protein
MAHAPENRFSLSQEVRLPRSKTSTYATAMPPQSTALPFACRAGLAAPGACIACKSLRTVIPCILALAQHQHTLPSTPTQPQQTTVLTHMGASYQLPWPRASTPRQPAAPSIAQRQ